MHLCLVFICLVFETTLQVSEYGEDFELSEAQQTSVNEHNEFDCEHRERSRYSKNHNQWPNYLELIKTARDEYVECARSANGCTNCHDGVITQDLAAFEAGITAQMMASAANITRITKYQIIDHKLYRSENCMFPFRCRGIEHFLTALLPDLPDTEFYLNSRDWPMISRYLSNPVPVFSFSKTKSYWDIMYPAWTFWEGGPALKIYPNGLGRWDKYVDLLEEASHKTPWHSKSPKAFFRGSRTSAERDPLVLLSRRCPKLVDAEYTKNQAWKSDKDTLGAPAAMEVPLEEHCRFKYLFNYRGVAASFRFKHLFLCNSLVFHVGGDWEEFFYPALRPWFHYIPIPSEASQDDIHSLLEFAHHYDKEMRKIAQNGADFVSQHLQFSDIFCYWKTLLIKYTNLLEYTVQKDDRLVRLD